MAEPTITDTEQGVAALLVMDHLRTLVTESPNEFFSRVDLLVVIDNIMSDPEFFTPETLARFWAIDAAPPEVL